MCVTIIIFLLVFTQFVPALKFYRNEAFIITGRGHLTFWSESPCEASTTKNIDCDYPADYKYPNDYLAAKWIDQHIPAEDLILNDLSWAGLYLLSFSIKNVVFSVLPGELRRAKECKVIWDQPDNPMHEQILISLIEKYAIKYIFVTAEMGYLDWWELGGDDLYKPKKKKPSVYGVIFAKYPFLIPVFQSGNSKIYKIMLEML